eukprot:2700886-Pleurochrysis_carterae.AAC.1
MRRDWVRQACEGCSASRQSAQRRERRRCLGCSGVTVGARQLPSSLIHARVVFTLDCRSRVASVDFTQASAFSPALRQSFHRLGNRGQAEASLRAARERRRLSTARVGTFIRNCARCDEIAARVVAAALSAPERAREL